MGERLQTYSEDQNLPSHLTEAEHRSSRQRAFQMLRMENIEELGVLLPLRAFRNGGLSDGQLRVRELGSAAAKGHE